MNRKCITLGLMGYPLDHSFSPQLHQAALKAENLSGKYHLFPVENEMAIRDICDRIRRREIDGLNVTIPYKSVIMSHVDYLTPTAQRIGAVNTLFMGKNKLVGHNTDAEGFLEDINAAFGEVLINNISKALILGAGGGARAVAYALCRLGWDITITARHSSQSLLIQKDFKDQNFDLSIVPFEREQLRNQTPEMIINTTPVGMHPVINCSPWPEGLAFPDGCVVYDLVYNPPLTKFLLSAQNEKKKISNGAGMLVAQAAAAFKCWTGISPQKDFMCRALNDALKEQERKI